MKDAVRLLVYLAATVLIGALFAPVLFWGAQAFAARGIFAALAGFDFETFFHRALLIAALVLLWPLRRSLELRSLSDLSLRPNPKWLRDLAGGFLISTIPLLCCAAVLLALHIFAWRPMINGPSAAKIVAASIVVPLIEEGFFRGLLLGALLRSGRVYLSIVATSALYSIIHFLKAPEHTSTAVTWLSGFSSIAHAFAQFTDPIVVLSGFTTLLLIGWILADARLLTRSLWLPVGLHAGWIFASQSFSKMTHRQMIALPWIGKNLLVGLVPLMVAAVSWLIVRAWSKRNGISSSQAV